MRRVVLVVATFVAAVGAIVGSWIVTPSPAGAAELVQVCITLQPRSINLEINGTTIIGQSIDGQPRTCIGV